jgi:hypothetical protein
MPWKKIKINFKLQMSFLRRPLTAFLASNLLAQFSRQIVVQILGMASPKVCGNLALLPFRGICSTMKLLGIFHVSNIRETLRMWELNFYSINQIPTIQNPVM